MSRRGTCGASDVQLTRAQALHLRAKAQEVRRRRRAAEQRDLLAGNFRQFVKDETPQLQIGTDLTWGWYLDAICDFLQAQINREIPLGIINLRNRSYKSKTGSVCLHPWAWLTQSHLRFFTGGYDHQLAVDHAWESRKLINSEWYQTLIEREDGEPAWALLGDQNAKNNYVNTCGGRRLAAQVGGGTGKGGHVFVIDDPLSIDDSWSDVANEKANRWFFQTVLSRLDDPKLENTIVNLTQHRLRPDDTSGVAIAEEHGFVVLDLALEFDPKRICVVDAIDFVDPRTEEGELLCEDRWGEREVEADKKRFSVLYEALCNQNPKKRGSKLVSDTWFRVWGSGPGQAPLPTSFDVVQSWDLSTKGLDPTTPKTQQQTRKRSKVGGICAYMTPSACYIVDRYHEHTDYLGQKPAVRAMHNRFSNTVRTHVEDQSNGSALILEMTAGEYTNDGHGNPIKLPGIRGINGVNPGKKGGKYQRFAAVSHYIKSGNVYVPDPEQYAWVKPFVQACCEFPNFPYDEDPDVLSQLLSEEWLPDGIPDLDDVSSEEQAEKIYRAYGRPDANPGVTREQVTREQVTRAMVIE